MPSLKTIKKSISEMTEAELEALIYQTRDNRREKKPTNEVKKTKAVKRDARAELAKLMGGMTKEERSMMLKDIQEEEE